MLRSSNGGLQRGVFEDGQPDESIAGGVWCDEHGLWSGKSGSGVVMLGRYGEREPGAAIYGARMGKMRAAALFCTRQHQPIKARCRPLSKNMQIGVRARLALYRFRLEDGKGRSLSRAVGDNR